MRLTARMLNFEGRDHSRNDGGEEQPEVRSCMPDGAGGHRVEADGCSLSQRAVEGVAQGEEPGERGGAPRARGALENLTAAAHARLAAPELW